MLNLPDELLDSQRTRDRWRRTGSPHGRFRIGANFADIGQGLSIVPDENLPAGRRIPRNVQLPVVYPDQRTELLAVLLHEQDDALSDGELRHAMNFQRGVAHRSAEEPQFQSRRRGPFVDSLHFKGDKGDNATLAPLPCPAHSDRVETTLPVKIISAFATSSPKSGGTTVVANAGASHTRQHKASVAKPAALENCLLLIGSIPIAFREAAGFISLGLSRAHSD